MCGLGRQDTEVTCFLITPLCGSQHINMIMHPDGSIFNVVWLACPIQPIGGLQLILNTESDYPDSSSLETGFT